MIQIYGQSEAAILQKIKQEHSYSRLFVDTKRVLFNNRAVLYNNPMKDEERINVNLCFQFMQTLLGIYYTDEPEVQFTTQEIRNEEIAENMDNVYKHDLKEMKMNQRKYLLHRYRFRYGVGIRIMTGRDKQKKMAKFQIVDPRCRVPDPNGSVMENDFRFHGFEMNAGLQDLISSGDYFNLEGLSGNQRTEDQRNKQYDGEHRGLNNPNDSSGNDNIPIYHHFTVISGRKFLFTTAENNSRLIRAEDIEAVTPDEKEDPSLIQFPVVINSRSPMPGDPFGICVPDIVEDKQKHMNKFYNLMLIKSSRMALGNDRFYDTRMLKNRTDLEKPTLGGRYIGVDGSMGPISNAIYEIPQEQIGQEVMNMPDMLRNLGYNDTGISEMTMGGLADRNVTAKESQTVQQNANIRLMLANEVNNRGEEQFALRIYRSYLEHFREVDKKFIRLNQGFNLMSIKLCRKEFLSNCTPYISVTQKSDVDALNQQNKANFMALYPILQQDPNLPNISKTFALRKLLKLNGLTRGEISVLSPPSTEEMEALQQLELINRDMPVEISSLDEDHLTFIVMFQRGFETDAKFMAIESRKQAYIESGQAQAKQMAMMQGQGGGASNMGANMLMSNAISKGQPQSSSIANVQPGGQI